MEKKNKTREVDVLHLKRHLRNWELEDMPNSFDSLIDGLLVDSHQPTNRVSIEDVYQISQCRYTDDGKLTGKYVIDIDVKVSFLEF